MICEMPRSLAPSASSLPTAQILEIPDHANAYFFFVVLHVKNSWLEFTFLHDSYFVMVMDKNLIAAIVVAQQLFASHFMFFDAIPTKHEQKPRKKRDRELTMYKFNVSVKYSMPTAVLIPQQVLDNLVLDPDRAYIKNIHIFMLGNFSS